MEKILFTFTVFEISIWATIFAVVQFFASTWIIERLKVSLQKEHTAFLEDLKWDLKIKEQSSRVAEYLALQRSLKDNSLDSDYTKANQLNWELAMWLPDQIYKEMVRSILQPSEDKNVLTTVLTVRKLLLGKRAGNLSANDVAHHFKKLTR